MGDLPELGVAYGFEAGAAGDDDDDNEMAGVTILVLHGDGGTEDSLFPAARRVAPGAALLGPRGTFPEDNGFRHLPPRTVEKPVNSDDTDPHTEAVHRRTAELAEFVGAASKALDLDAEDVWAFGFSDGATAAAALAYDHPATLAGAVILSGREPFRAPGGRVIDAKQIFCATGRHDELVTIDDYEELVEGLVTAGADVELHWYDTGHEICDQELDDAREWLRKRLA